MRPASSTAGPRWRRSAPKALKGDAIAAGTATGETAIGPLTLTRLGSGTTTVLVATLPEGIESAPAPVEQAAEPPASVQPAASAPPEDIQNEAAPASPPAAEAPPAEAPPPPEAPPAEAAPAEVASEAPPAAGVAELIPLDPASPVPERRQPLRFVWNMDADERFTLVVRAFAVAAGPHTAQLIGKPWREIAAELALDPEARVANAVASRDTFSGVSIAWPVDETGETMTVELSGLPIFDRDRNFLGYRGFGVCREAARAPAPRAEVPAAPTAPVAPAAPEQPPEAPAPEARPQLTVVPAAKNVVPFRGVVPEKRPTLTPIERSAFHELAETLGKGATPAPEAVETAPKPAREAPADTLPSAFAQREAPTQASGDADQLVVLERLPVGVLIHRAEALLYANRAFLEWTGYADLAAVAHAGGLERLVVDSGAGALDRATGHRQDLHDRDARGRHADLRGPALYRAVAGRERLDAGAGAHRRRRPAEGLRACAAHHRSRDARAPDPFSTPRPTA